MTVQKKATKMDNREFLFDTASIDQPFDDLHDSQALKAKAKEIIEQQNEFEQKITSYSGW